MAEIIKFPGNRKNAEQKQTANAEDKDGPHINHMIRFLTALLKSDPRSYNEENIAERQDGLREFEDDELGTMVNQSTQAMWQEKPSFYHALIRELRRRNLFGERQGE